MGNTFSFIAIMSYVQLVWCPALLIRALLTGHHSAFECTQHICSIVEMMVWLAVPMSSLYAWLGASTWYFNRKPGIDRAAFSKWIDDQWNTRPEFGLVAYPEGTRNLTDKPHKLKTGVLWYAWEYKRKIQVVITANKDKLVNEKKLYLKRGQILVTHYSKVVDPGSFETRDDFIEKVRETFVESWEKCHEDPSKCAEQFVPPFGHSAAKLKSQGKTRGHRALILRILLLLAVLIVVIARSKSIMS